MSIPCVVPIYNFRPGAPTPDPDRQDSPSVYHIMLEHTRLYYFFFVFYIILYYFMIYTSVHLSMCSSIHASMHADV